MIMTHGLHLLTLIRCKDGVQLLHGRLTDRMQLLLARVIAESAVAHEGSYLLFAVGEDRLDLGCLVGGEVELPGEASCFALRIGSMMALDRRWRLLDIGRGLLREDHAAR